MATVGFKAHAILKELSKAEIIERNLPVIWHAQFLLPLKCVSTFCGTFTIPKGFITDGASIPTELWSVLSDTSPDILYPSFAHDFCYSVHGYLPKNQVTRDQADNMLRELMIAIGTPRWKADICYRAVHMWGTSPWTKPTPSYKLAATPYRRNAMASGLPPIMVR